MPKLPKGINLRDLQLDARTYNCLLKLRRSGIFKQPYDLANLTIGEILETQGFGPRCLVDLLTALESVASPTKSTPQGQVHACLEDELSSLILESGTERYRQIVARRYGFDGQGGATLQAVADVFGITRERVRQICERFESSLKGRKMQLRILNSTLNTVAENTPGSAEEIESKLISAGLTRRPFRLEGLMNAARLLSRDVPFVLEEIGHKRIAFKAKTRFLSKSIIQTARKSVEHWGVATVEDIASQVNAKTGIDIDAESVILALSTRGDFSWLDEARGWFWLSATKRNRLLNQIRKVLSVTARINIGELRNSIARHHRMEGFAPPRRVLLELCRQAKEYTVDGETVTAEPALSWEEVLEGVEKTLVQIFKTNGPVLQRTKLEELCSGAGVNRTTFAMYLGYSPIVTRYGIGVYGLPGTDISPGGVEALIINKRRPTRVLIDYGWTENGRVWLGYNLSEGMISNGVFSVPSGMVRFLEGEFVLQADEGSKIGEITIKGNRGWNLGAFFRRRGGEAGDYLLLLFDLAKHQTIIRIGGTDLFDEFRPGNEGE